MKNSASFLAAAVVLATVTAARADEAGDLVVARSWLAAAAHDGTALGTVTAFPFIYRTTNKIKRCERAVRNAAAFFKWATCFQKRQKVLLGQIKAGAHLQGASTRDAESKALRALGDKVPNDGRWLRAFINGDGVTFTFLFKVAGDSGAGKVTAVVLEEDIENG